MKTFNMKKIIPGLFLLSAVVLANGCAPTGGNNIDPTDNPGDQTPVEKVEKSLQITHLPTKQDYFEGDKFEREGLQVSVIYDDDSSKIINDFEILDEDRELTLDDAVMVVKYKELTAKIPITVDIRPTPSLTCSLLYLEVKNNTEVYLVVEGTHHYYTTSLLERDSKLYLENDGTYDGSNSWAYAIAAYQGKAEINGDNFKFRFRLDNVDSLDYTTQKGYITHFETLYTDVSNSKSTPETTIGNLRVPLKDDSVNFTVNEIVYGLEINQAYNIPELYIAPLRENEGPGEITDYISACDQELTSFDEDKYYLGKYGDYVEWIDKTKDPSLLEAYYKDLLTVTTTPISESRELNYQKGLLALFSIDNEIKLNITISDEELQKLNHDNQVGNRESYRICDLDVELLGIRIHYREVGIRQKGNTSRGEILTGNRINLRHYKLKFKEQFNDEFTETPYSFTNADAKKYRKNRTLFGMEKMDLRRNTTADKTFLREYYAYEGFRANGGISSRSNPMHITLTNNGATENMGIYLGVECVDDTFLARNYKADYATGDLYKCGWGNNFDSSWDNNFGVETLTKNTGRWGDSFNQTSYLYDLKTNKKTSDHSALKGFINNLGNTNSSTITNFIKTNTIYEDFITYNALAYLNGDADDLRGNTNNTYVYMITNTQIPQFVLMPLDNDQSNGAAERDFRQANPTGHRASLNNPFDTKTGHGDSRNCRVLSKTLYDTASTTIRRDYLNKVHQVLQSNWFKPATFKTYYDKAYEHYHDDTTLGTRIIGTQNEFSFTDNLDPSTGWALDISVYLQNKESTFYNWCATNNVNFN